MSIVSLNPYEWLMCAHTLKGLNRYLVSLLQVVLRAGEVGLGPHYGALLSDRCSEFPPLPPGGPVAQYKVVLEENLLPSALTMFPNSEDWFFQQDNAPCHTARSIKVWMEDHQIKTLSWPAQSPDLNPIENLWNVIKRKMDGHKPSNKAELLEFLRQEWHKVTQHQCERLVESMPRRMKAVLENQGYSTKY